MRMDLFLRLLLRLILSLCTNIAMKLRAWLPCGWQQAICGLGKELAVSVIQ